MSRDFDQVIDHALALRASHHQLRSRRMLKHLDAVHVELDGKRLVNFCSNNYLGLTHHPRLLGALKNATETGAGAAGLISGHTQIHADAESAIANWKQTESALLMPSGYQANFAAIQTLFALAETSGRKVRFVIDKLAHASLIDAVRLTQSEFRVFPHNGIDKLARLLEGAPTDELQVVVTESIFSMDGDAADLRAIAALKQKRDFVVVVDEAHGSGVYGPAGSGVVAELGLRDAVDVSIVTLSKALGISGGAICGSKKFIDAALNFGRAYIYSTAVSPIIAMLAREAISILHDEPQQQARVRELAARVRRGLAGCDLELIDGDSPIIPIIYGDEQRAIAEAKRLEQLGLLVMPVRPPTVPRGSSRLRLTVSAAHTDAEIDTLIHAFGV